MIASSVTCRITGVAGDAVHMETADSAPFTIDLGDRDASMAVAVTLAAVPALLAACRSALALLEDRDADEYIDPPRIAAQLRAAVAVDDSPPESDRTWQEIAADDAGVPLAGEIP